MAACRWCWPRRWAPAARTTAAPEGDRAVGLDINANHLRSVTSGWVTGTARPVHRGRSTQVWQIELTQRGGRADLRVADHDGGAAAALKSPAARTVSVPSVGGRRSCAASARPCARCCGPGRCFAPWAPSIRRPTPSRRFWAQLLSRFSFQRARPGLQIPAWHSREPAHLFRDDPLKHQLCGNEVAIGTEIHALLIGRAIGSQLRRSSSSGSLLRSDSADMISRAVGASG
jgi:hypothetical protein